MERLTKKADEPLPKVGIKYLRNGADKDSFDILNKLGKYEDLEEQGLLLKLPCKVGDVVYVIPSKVNYKMNEIFGGGINGVCMQTVDRIEYGKYGLYVSTCDGSQGHREENFGETWFLTKEEAEQALERRRNG